MEDDNDLRLLFENSDNESLLLETGFRKPIFSLTCVDKALINETLCDYHFLVKVKAELDQFSKGLETLGVLEETKKYPSLMSSLFVKKEGKKINKGIHLNKTKCTLWFYPKSCILCLLLAYFKSLFKDNILYSTDCQEQRDREEAAYVRFY